ncbi:tetratricopeptide repeat protein [Candidatus Uhrbacteria bacterium]|nr:tetratricopeptide repeat protein [Candidatus Uhrbacteria bacterium]
MANAKLNNGSIKQAILEQEPPKSTLHLRHKKKRDPEGIFTILIEWVYGILLFLSPFFFLPSTSDVFDLNKQTLLFVATLIIAILYSIRIVTVHTVDIRGSFLTLAALLLLGIWLTASIFSVYPFQSFLGIDGQAHMSFATLLAILVLIGIATSLFEAKHIIRLARVMIVATSLLSLVGLLQIFGVFVLPWGFTKTALFSPTGTINSLGTLAAFGLVLTVAEIIRMATAQQGRKWLSILFAIGAGLQLITLVVFDEWQLWISVIGGLALVIGFLFFKLPKDQKVVWLVLPSFVCVFALTMIALASIGMSIPRLVVPIQTPSLTVQTSWNIAIRAMQERPILGYGPGNFLTAFTAFRPAEVNNENAGRLWTARFNQSGSHLATKVVSLGLVGLVALALFFLAIIVKAAFYLFRNKVDENYAIYLGVVSVLATLGIISAVKEFDFTLTLFSWTVIGFFSVLTGRSLMVLRGKNSSRFIVLSSFVLFGVISIALVGTIFIGMRYAADVTFRNASMLDREISSGLEKGEQANQEKLNQLVTTLDRAARMNPFNRNYLVALSQALIYKASLLASDRQNTVSVQTISNDAVATAQRAVALNPKDVRNIENLTQVLQALYPFVENGFTLGQQAHEQALSLDPTNPEPRVEASKLYLSAYAMLKGQEANLQKEEEKAQSAGQAKQALEKAESYLQDALKLKGDYPEAHFHLGTIYATQDKKDEALQEFDKALNLNYQLISFRASDETLFYNLGVNYESLDQNEKAQAAYKFAWGLRPNYYLAMWRSALLDEKAGNKEAALDTLNRVVALDPTNTIVQDKIKELQSGQKQTTDETKENKKGETPEEGGNQEAEQGTQE